MSHTPERDPTAWIRFHNYERGWRDGATGRVIARYEATTPVDVREPYGEGYTAGRNARLAMHGEAMKTRAASFLDESFQR